MYFFSLFFLFFEHFVVYFKNCPFSFKQKSSFPFFPLQLSIYFKDLNILHSFPDTMQYILCFKKVNIQTFPALRAYLELYSGLPPKIKS